MVPLNADAIPSVSLADQAYLLIRDKILRGDLPFGAPLSRRQLAPEFNMSFQPVSESIQRLEWDGVLESLPRVGTRVKVPTENDVREQFTLREALESQAARLCAERATFQERLELRRAAGELDQMFLALSGDESDASFVSSLQSRHFSFHMRIAEFSRHAVLFHAIEKNQVLIFNCLHRVSMKGVSSSGSHRALIDVITKGTPEEADRAMRWHIHFGLEDVLAALAARTSRGGWRLDRAEAVAACRIGKAVDGVAV